MKNQRTYLLCEHCGNLVGMIHDAGVPMMCCGHKMTLIEPNTKDAAQEKHVPALTREAGSLKVTVGSVEHPMTQEHYITWIAVAQGNRTQRVALTPADKPSACFCVEDGEPVTVYAYCNLHGLWSAEG